MLINGPGEFIVELPGDNRHQQRAHRHDAGNDDEKRLGFAPNVIVDRVVVGQHTHGFFDLLHLHGSVDQQPNVTDTQSDDLNRVLHAQSIVHQHQLVDESETVQREEGRDGFRGGHLVGFGLQLNLEIGEDITGTRPSGLARLESMRHQWVGIRGQIAIPFERQGDDGLNEGDDGKGPRPERIWDVHSAFWRMGRHIRIAFSRPKPTGTPTKRGIERGTPQ